MFKQSTGKLNIEDSNGALGTFLNNWIYYTIYAVSFFLMSLQILPDDIFLFVAVATFLVAPLDVSAYLYIFSLPWAEVGVFSFGLTISLIQTCIYIVKIIFIKKRLNLRIVDIAIIVYMLFMCIINLFIHSSLNGVSMLLYFVIASQIFYNYMLDDENDEKFWNFALFFLSVSVLFATIYGFRAGTSLDRWLSGLGFVLQLYGTLGTTRFGMYLCICIVYALFYIKRKWVRITVCIFASIGIFSTVSMTALLLMVLLYLYYFVFYIKTVSMRKKLIFLGSIALLIIIIALSWNLLRSVSFIEPIVVRTEKVYENLIKGDLDYVTTGRNELGEIYLNKFQNGNILNRIFGYGSYSIEDAANYSHNSYLDMLNYCGLIGAGLFIWLQVQRFIQYKKLNKFTPAFIIKIIVLLTGATVSVFSSQYWQIWFFM